jgi:hypothetical protein
MFERDHPVEAFEWARECMWQECDGVVGYGKRMCRENPLTIGTYPMTQITGLIDLDTVTDDFNEV